MDDTMDTIVVMDAIVVTDGDGATVLFGNDGWGSHVAEAEFDTLNGAMRAAVECGGTVRLVVTP